MKTFKPLVIMLILILFSSKTRTYSQDSSPIQLLIESRNLILYEAGNNTYTEIIERDSSVDFLSDYVYSTDSTQIAYIGHREKSTWVVFGSILNWIPKEIELTPTYATNVNYSIIWLPNSNYFIVSVEDDNTNQILARYLIHTKSASLASFPYVLTHEGYTDDGLIALKFVTETTQRHERICSESSLVLFVVNTGDFDCRLHSNNWTSLRDLLDVTPIIWEWSEESGLLVRRNGTSTIIFFPATSQQVELLETDYVSYYQPYWSPDGTKFLFLTHNYTISTQTYLIYNIQNHQLSLIKLPFGAIVRWLDNATLIYLLPRNEVFETVSIHLYSLKGEYSTLVDVSSLAYAITIQMISVDSRLGG